MQVAFETKYAEWRAPKKNHYILESDEAYNERFNAVVKRNASQQLLKDERNWAGRFTIKEVNGEQRLSKGDKLVIIRHEVFGILHEAHIRLGHAGRDIMDKDLSNYHGLSKEIIEVYLSLCSSCQLKQAKVKKSVVVKPILSSDFNARCQVDLIDLQARPDGDFKFIMVYQDHLTKFVVLNALKTKTAAEVAQKLISIFATFGAPKILHSDNGKEFANKIVAEVVAKWPSCRIVHGKPRHSQSQGSVERANRDIGDILTIWLRDSNSTKWANALPMVQAMKNRRYHNGIKRSPYEAMVGKKMELGYESQQMPANDEQIGNSSDDESFKTIVGTEWLDVNREIGNKAENHFDENTNDLVEPIQLPDEEDALANPEDYLHLRYVSQQDHRQGAREGQISQAKKMLESSNKRYAPIGVGTSVRIPVPDVDRSKIDPRNLMGVVMEAENGFYKIGTSAGVLSHQYSRNQIEPCLSSFLSIDQVPNKEISLRKAVGESSVSKTTQGHVHCNCTEKCTSNRCGCKKAGRKCNSRCHNSHSCENK